MKDMIYLSGCMGAYVGTLQENYPFEWRRKIEEYLGEYFKIFNPTQHYSYNHSYQNTEKEVMLYELDMIRRSRLVVVNLKDIEKSPGTICELMCAYENKIPIIGFIENSNDDSILLLLHPWLIEMCTRIEEGMFAITDVAQYIHSYYRS